MSRMLMVRQEPMFVAQISASHELNEVRSCQSAFQVSGPPEQKRMAPLMLRNLNRGSWMPSRMALPIWEPQRVICILTESKLLKDGFDLDVPVSRAAAEAVKCPFQQPIFILLSIWITKWGFDDSNFIGR